MKAGGRNRSRGESTRQSFRAQDGTPGRMRRPLAAAPGAGAQRAPVPAGTPRRATDHSDLRGARDPAARRSASRSLWTACEAFLSTAEPRRVNQALDELMKAFECDGVALHVMGPAGVIEPWCARGAWRTSPGDLRDCVSVPLLRGSERVGTLDLKARAARCWQPAQLGLIRTAAGALGAALGARLELERLRRQPGRDSVTGLPDARAFHGRFSEELARARRHGLPLAVLAMDLDHFGALNAKLGRDVGDTVLSEISIVLKLALRESDFVARLGGDGFAIMLPETELSPALRCADRIQRAIEEHRFARAGHVTASLGLATSPRDGLETVELLECAERALSIAKKSGRRRVIATGHAHAH
jgi:diguanylate cyclase (GGDEF)-like protein